MRRALALVLLALTACSGGEPAFERADLERLVLAAEDAPLGTTLDQAASGYRDADSFAEDAAEAEALRAANFRDAYIAFFPSPGALSGDDPDAALAVSYALLFATPDDARAGLEVVRADVVADGEDLTERPAGDLGEGAFGLEGTLEPGRPPGYVFAWRVGNAVLALVAAGTEGAVNEDAVRVLVARVDARARG